MKFLAEFEDCLVGIIIGAALIGMSERFFTLPFARILVLVLAPVGIGFALFDVVHHIKHAGSHLAAYALINGHNFLNIAILLALFSALLNAFSIPFLTDQGVIIIASEVYLFYAGIYFAGTYIIHMIFERFFD